jgi:C-terminal processing protease CtpA/Prc
VIIHRKVPDKKIKDRVAHSDSSRINKKLKFSPDSTIAILTTSRFYNVPFPKLYHDIFIRINSSGAETLILDLRGNPGGKIREASCLYSYLVDSSYFFIKKSEVVSRTSLLHTGYFRGAPLYGKIILLAFVPFRVIRLGVIFLHTKKDSDKHFYFSLSGSKSHDPKIENFKGRIYVLIDEGSYSAASLLASDLKGSGRAFFVGEETGGASNGCVAGIMVVYTLPNSKLKTRFGLMQTRPYFEPGIWGRGILPDKEIKPTLEDYINKNDPALKWTLDEITGKHKE